MTVFHQIKASVEFCQLHAALSDSPDNRRRHVSSPKRGTKRHASDGDQRLAHRTDEQVTFRWRDWAVRGAGGGQVRALTPSGDLAIVAATHRADNHIYKRPRPMGENATMPMPPTSPTPRSDSISMASPPEPNGSVQQLVPHVHHGHRVSEGSRTAGAGYEPSRWAA